MNAEEREAYDRRIEGLVAAVADIIVQSVPGTTPADATSAARLVVEKAASPVERHYRTDGYSANATTGEVKEVRPIINVLVRFKSLGTFLAAAVTTAAEAHPLLRLAPMAVYALIEVVTFVTPSRVLDRVDAIVVLAVLLNQAEEGSVSVDELARLVQVEAAQKQWESPTDDQVFAALSRLRQGGVLSSPSEGRIRAAADVRLDLTA